MRQLSERRGSKRIKKTLHVLYNYWGKPGIWSEIVVEDISNTGVRLISKKALAINEMLELRISTFLRTLPVSIIGKVLSCEKEPKRNNWIIRISIVRIIEEDEVIFRKIIQMFSKENNKDQ